MGLASLMIINFLISLYLMTHCCSLPLNIHFLVSDLRYFVTVTLIQNVYLHHIPPFPDLDRKTGWSVSRRA